jgi:Predicted integral membrane protein (DUF2269)
MRAAMNKDMKSSIKTLHLLFAGLWLGSSASIVLLHSVRGWSENGQELAVLNRMFSILDFALIIPGAMGSLFTGYWICKKTSWGFTRYRWVIAKWICTSIGILSGTALLGPSQMRMVELTSRIEDSLTPGGSYVQIRWLFAVVGVLQVFLLITMLVLSVRKPWGKRIPVQQQIRQAPMKQVVQDFE